MRIGCCCNIEDAAIAQSAGFDFIECRVTSLLPEEHGDNIPNLLAQYKASPLPVAAMNVFIPKELSITGKDVDEDRLLRYVESALARAHRIDCEIVVFGSGGARSIPKFYAREKARKQIIRFLRNVGDVAASSDITVVIEPLNRKESNIILSVPEAVAIANEVDHPRIKVLADFYHMDEEQEPLEHLLQYKQWLKHIHVADTGRLAPGTGQYPYTEFADYLRETHYDGMISIECRWQDFATEAGPACTFLRQTF